MPKINPGTTRLLIPTSALERIVEALLQGEEGEERENVEGEEDNQTSNQEEGIDPISKSVALAHKEMRLQKGQPSGEAPRVGKSTAAAEGEKGKLRTLLPNLPKVSIS